MGLFLLASTSSGREERFLVGKKIFCVFFICITFFFAICSSNYIISHHFIAYSSSIIDQHRENQARAKSKKNALEKTLKETQKKVDDKRRQYDSVNSKIISVKERKIKINKRVDDLRLQIEQVKRDIAAKEREVAENTEILKRRLAAIYKAGEVQLIDLVFNAKTFEELIDKAEIITKVSDHDNRLLSALKDDISSLDGMKTGLVNQEASLVAETNSLTEVEAQLRELLAQNETLLKQLESDKSRIQAEIYDADVEVRQIQNAIDMEVARLRRNNGGNLLSLANLSDIPKSKWVWPVLGGFTRRSSEYMERRGNVYHKGIDIASKGIYGASVVAVDDGVVFAAFNGCPHDFGKWYNCHCGGGYGNYVMIRHTYMINGKIVIKVSIYGHLSRVCVSLGQSVKKGQKIGEVGSTGHSTGPHLHFQTKFNGVTDYNPLSESYVYY